MASSYPGDEDVAPSGCPTQPQRSLEAETAPANRRPTEEGLLAIDATGQVIPFDLKAIDHTRKTFQLNQRFARMWQVPEDTLNRMRIEQELRRALDRKEFALYFQPQADVATNHIVGAEALVRWRHPDRGLLLPDEFIPIAEDSGLIVELGELVLRAACEQAVKWEAAGLPQMRIAVNLSAVQFRDAGLAGMVASVLDETGVDPRRLELEITESTAMRQAALALEILNALTQLGVRISLDDFGTGYSSLQHLKEFPIYALKVDRSFVSGITLEGNTAGIVRAIVAIGQSLGLKVIAEGVETLDQLAFLKDQSCDWYQGFLLARPVSPETFSSLRQQRAA